ncbi:alpha/beta hydrolase [Halobacillus trueperi]|uniref:Alpha/beta hydrolase n=1 Tax=Halobacillus trueperi TaxID=156205 RepID=A0A3E0J0Q9_9BACI|nr:alpha/beta hydrolase [Halobacillus trueperi]REJ06444.1 alpha/beta hydrolase [Halobacillus trueperi]
MLWKKWAPILMGSLLIGLLFFMINSRPGSSEPVDREDLVPTLFVHGFKGGPRSFETMMDRMQNLQWGQKHMTVYVSNRGHVTIRGGFAETHNPFIQVLFENNRASIYNQTHWLSEIMRRLKADYNIQQVNLVGHSMGGIASVNYLLSDHQYSVPRVEKLSVIASPFKGIEKEGYFASNYGAATTDLRPNSEALKQMVQNKDQFPNDVEVFAIAGVINADDPEAEHWDGLVHASSVSGLEEIVPFGQYEEKRLYNPLATHSGLHELEEVDQLLKEFFWTEEGE